MRAGRRAVALAVLALLLASCGSVTTGNGTSAPPGSSGGATPSASLSSVCPDASALEPTSAVAGQGRLGEELVPEYAVECVLDSQKAPGEGTWTVLVERRATVGVDALAAALRRPSEPPATGACDAMLVLIPWIALVDAQGRWVHPDAPRDSCGHPQAAVRAALDSLTWTTVRTARVRQELSAEQAAASARAQELGCSYEFKDMVAIEAADGPDQDPARPLLTGSPADLLLCRYAVDPSAADPVARFVSGSALDAAASATAVGALAASGPATAACARAHTDLVGLFSRTSDAWVLAELDGCGRAASGTGALRTLPAASVATLRALAP